jgi:transcription elongation factor Elf1
LLKNQSSTSVVLIDIICHFGCLSLFTCKKCQESLYILNAELQDHILTLETQCLNGHKSARRLAEHQVQDVSPEIFKKMFVCTECGLNMTLVDTIVQGLKTEGIFLCPCHGIQKREFPREYLSTIQVAAAEVDSPRAIIDSFRCPQCGLVYAVSGIELRRGIIEVDVRCANGHKTNRYLPGNLEPALLKKILQRVVHCDKCGLPGHIASVEQRGSTTRVYSTCPVHGATKKDIPTLFLDSLREAVSEIPEDAVLRATLTAHECRQPLAIRSITDDKSGYKLSASVLGQSL